MESILEGPLTTRYDCLLRDLPFEEAFPWPDEILSVQTWALLEAFLSYLENKHRQTPIYRYCNQVLLCDNLPRSVLYLCCKTPGYHWSQWIRNLVQFHYHLKTTT